jgi:hypothetical protein
MAMGKTADVYFKGTAPPFMRGREKEEVRWSDHRICETARFSFGLADNVCWDLSTTHQIHWYDQTQSKGEPTRDVVGVTQLRSKDQTDSLGRKCCTSPSSTFVSNLTRSFFFGGVIIGLPL